ncbi:non-hydrolyzing UDP-N-acetylglucosamine 2-epimerase [Desulfoluna spongiiphila]|uniref:UDP-N-acetylglucosamine 2-epimerase (Non-hydrolysing) n=1 Tax=Desulfoluna spongiiphila TaxID=419481 RepID=A0A1G5BYP2_9BACT|nr:UDP-N-acetylglucosamine 2-epimerase (non-hydrolyzing) [Desulfoluna spongiiphila]SCX95197.1 UDP-N-acetylglucosamine 2-epimerase (non-hydrolysing) [Desulfoluna spongiiphila]
MTHLKKRIHLIAAARPNFMKIAPLYHVLARSGWAEPVIVHTGQHYDDNMSDAFFRDFHLPEPHIHLGVGSGSHAEQTGRVMMAYERVLLKDPPDLLVVVGDVNSTLATTIAAAKLGVPIAHLEAGLRSFDMSMPEEINRLVTDRLSHYLWTPSQDGDANLMQEGVAPEKIQFVGNIMIDAFEMLREKIEARSVCTRHHLKAGNYGVVTLHRPSNVDDDDTLKALCEVLVRISKKIPLVFPVHPRTAKRLAETSLMDGLKAQPNLTFCDPLGYIEFMSLVCDARFVLTDSGGVQEETTYLKIPCLTLRPNTERPVTVTIGSNRLCTVRNIEASVDGILQAPCHGFEVPELWDGQTAQRVASSIRKIVGAEEGVAHGA